MDRVGCQLWRIYNGAKYCIFGDTLMQAHCYAPPKLNNLWDLEMKRMKISKKEQHRHEH